MYNVLNFHRSTLYPANVNAAGILQRLRTLQLEHLKAFYDVKTDKEDRLQNLCFALPGWQDEFAFYGIASGVSIEGKAVSCKYVISLVAINGKSNNGKFLTFFLGSIATKAIENYVWFLKNLRYATEARRSLWPPIKGLR